MGNKFDVKFEEGSFPPYLHFAVGSKTSQI